MKKILLLYCFALAFTLTGRAQDEGKYIPLFNGRDLTNWVPQRQGCFEVLNGELITRSFGAGNDIFSDRVYGNFVLRLEFMLSEVGNSGVFIRCKPNDPGAGFEIQLLAPWTPWRDDLHCTGSVYGHVAVKDRPDETTGVWYKMEIRCDRTIVTVSVNDKVTTMANTDTVKTMEGIPFTGVIGFQGNHASKQGQFARFRNISIRDLDSEPDYVLKGFSEKNEQVRTLAQAATVNLGAGMISRLAGLMPGDDPAAVSGAKQALFDIVAKASDPASDKERRKEVSDALKSSIKNSSDDITANYLKWLSGLISR
jgi:hypothetical protein